MQGWRRSTDAQARSGRSAYTDRRAGADATRQRELQHALHDPSTTESGAEMQRCAHLKAWQAERCLLANVASCMRLKLPTSRLGCRRALFCNIGEVEGRGCCCNFRAWLSQYGAMPTSYPLPLRPSCPVLAQLMSTSDRPAQTPTSVHAPAHSG